MSIEKLPITGLELRLSDPWDELFNTIIVRREEDDEHGIYRWGVCLDLWPEMSDSFIEADYLDDLIEALQVARDFIARQPEMDPKHP